MSRATCVVGTTGKGASVHITRASSQSSPVSITLRNSSPARRPEGVTAAWGETRGAWSPVRSVRPSIAVSDPPRGAPVPSHGVSLPTRHLHTSVASTLRANTVAPRHGRPYLLIRHDGRPRRAHGTARSVLLVECIMRMREALVHTLLQLTLYPPWHKGPGQCSATHTLARRCSEQGGHEQRQTPRTRSGAAAASVVQRMRSPVRTAATPRSALYATTHAPPLRVDHAHETGAATPALDADLTPLPAWTRMAQQ